MRCQSLMILSLVGASLIASSAPSSARPNTQATETAQRAERERATEQVRRARNIRDASRRQMRNASSRAAKRTRLVATPVSTRGARPIFGWPALVSEARKYMGTNPTARKRLWCATFMNMVLAKTGYTGTGSDAAKSFASYGRRISEPQIGAIAVLTRGKRGGHVGIVTGIDKAGNPVIISGNHGRRVGEARYSRSRVIAYVMPTERSGRTQIASAVLTPPLRAVDALEEELSSPIAELLAAINAERPDRPRAVSEPAQRPPVVAARPAQPPVPRDRLVQQVADVPRAGPLPAARDMSLNQALNELLGVRRAQAEPRRP